MMLTKKTVRQSFKKAIANLEEIAMPEEVLTQMEVNPAAIGAVFFRYRNKIVKMEWEDLFKLHLPEIDLETNIDTVAVTIFFRTKSTWGKFHIGITKKGENFYVSELPVNPSFPELFDQFFQDTAGWRAIPAFDYMQFEGE